MTFEALQNAIARLIVARREAHGNEAEQARINAKLDKLYNLKYTILEQAAKQNLTKTRSSCAWQQKTARKILK